MISDWTQRIGLVVHLACFIHVDRTRKLHRGGGGGGRGGRLSGGSEERGLELAGGEGGGVDANGSGREREPPALIMQRLFFETLSRAVFTGSRLGLCNPGSWERCLLISSVIEWPFRFPTPGYGEESLEFFFVISWFYTLKNV